MCHFCWRWQHSTHILRRCVSWETDERFRQRIEIGPHPLNHAKTKVLNFSDHCLGVDSWVLLPECFIILSMRYAECNRCRHPGESYVLMPMPILPAVPGAKHWKGGGRIPSRELTYTTYGRRQSSSIIFPATFKGSTLVSESVCCRGF